MLAAIKLSRALRAFHTVKQDIPLYAIETFLEIAAQPGITTTQVANRLGISIAATSRHVNLLMSQDRRGGQGLQLVEARPSTDPRQHELHLSERGRFLMQTITDLL